MSQASGDEVTFDLGACGTVVLQLILHTHLSKCQVCLPKVTWGVSLCPCPIDHSGVGLASKTHKLVGIQIWNAQAIPCSLPLCGLWTHEAQETQKETETLQSRALGTALSLSPGSARQ